MLSLPSRRGKHIFKHFKALGNPVRFLIIYRMLDGRPYTKNDILDYVSSLSGLPRTTVDRHFRTLLKYDIIKITGKSTSHVERGRKPLLYVLAADSLMFYVNLFTYLLDGVADKRLKQIERNLSGIKTFLEMIRDLKLKLYLIGHEVSNEVIIDLSKTLDSCTSSASLVKEALRPRTFVTDCESAIELLGRISVNQVLLERIPSDKIKELLYVAYIESNIPIEKLGSLLELKNLTKLRDDDLWDKIESLYGNNLTSLLKLLVGKAECTDMEASYIISLTNNLVKYLSSSIMNYDLIPLILKLF